MQSSDGKLSELGISLMQTAGFIYLFCALARQLNVLACQPNLRGVVEGTVMLDGKLRDPSTFRRIMSYIPQDDVLLATATVRETFLTSAYLKLPQSMPTSEKRQLVEHLLDYLVSQQLFRRQAGLLERK